jgi:5-methylcytosine-specific restriction endonuclease McrA
VRNGAVGARNLKGEFITDLGMSEANPPVPRSELKESGLFRVVLTIAHLVEGGPLDCPDNDLQALCERCHNQLDAPMRARNRRKTLHAKKACSVLPLE